MGQVPEASLDLIWICTFDGAPRPEDLAPPLRLDLVVTSAVPLGVTIPSIADQPSHLRCFKRVADLAELVADLLTEEQGSSDDNHCNKSDEQGVSTMLAPFSSVTSQL